MSALDKWAHRVYAETDFGRSIATSLSGLLGLGIYLAFGDWVIAVFASIIFFPIARLTATSIHTRFAESADRQVKRANAERTYNSLTNGEKAVICEFVNAGGCVLLWRQVNGSSISNSAIESLIQREVLSTSMTADGMHETFVLEPYLFDIGVKRAKE